MPRQQALAQVLVRRHVKDGPGHGERSVAERFVGLLRHAVTRELRLVVHGSLCPDVERRVDREEREGDVRHVGRCDERVLEVGTGSGYAAAVLARLAADVYSVECLPALYERARARLEAIEITNVHLSCSDGSEGWPEQAPFDAIIVTAAMPGIARPLLEQLKPDGRLVAPIGEDDLQTLVRISRCDDAWCEEYFGECRFVKMTGRYGFKTQ